MPAQGDKMSYRNDNMVIKDHDDNMKYQVSCYRLFMLLVIGDCTITSGLIRRAKKYGFTICFMTYGFKFYGRLNCGLEGNNLLHKKQYEYAGTEIGKIIITNKIINQRETLNKIRKKSDFVKEGIGILDSYISKLQVTQSIERGSLLGIEGNAARVYFARLFGCFDWKNRKPRIKFDYLNSLLDIGYNLLFNFIESLLQVYDFDVYHGVLHTDFYMRKSLVCDIMEPFRPLIDWKVRIGIRLGEFKKDDFIEIKHQWQLQYKMSIVYARKFMEVLLENKENIFLYIRSFYRAFMKGNKYECYPLYLISENEVNTLEEEL